MNKSIIGLILALTLMSCYDTGKNCVIPIWSEPRLQQQLLDLRGNVKELNSYLSDGVTTSETTPPESEDYIHFMTQKFNNLGQLEYYNTTNTEPNSTPQPESRIGVTPKMVYYHYTYDTQGRISTVKMHDVGRYGTDEPFTYIITYGEHTKFVPAPFSVGGIPIYLLKGVTEITSQTNIPNASYSLTFDGESAESSYIDGISTNPTQRSVYTYDSRYPKTITTSALIDGQPIFTKVEEYDWNQKGVLGSLTTTTTPSGAEDKIEIIKKQTTYSDSYTLKPLNHIWWLNGVKDASFKYQYNNEGLAIGGAYITTGDYPHKGSYAPIPFTWIYEYDAEKNWIVKVEPKTSGEEDPNIDYINRWTQEFQYY